jgi:ankyrin repeat protein
MDNPHEGDNSLHPLRRSGLSRIRRFADNSPEQKLLQALADNSETVVRELKDYAASPLDREDNTPLHVAHTLIMANVILELIGKNRQALNQLNILGQTPLHRMRDINVMQALLQAGADARILNDDGQSALHIAAIAARDPNEQGYIAEDPMQNGKMALLFIEHLKSSSDAINRRKKDGRTSLHVVKNIEVAKALITAGANLGSQDNGGRTPLHVAAHAGIVQLLLTSGAQARALDFSDQMPVHTLTDMSALRALLDSNSDGVNVSTLDAKHNTPLHVAQNKEVALLLLTRGARISSLNNLMETPLAKEHTRALLNSIEQRQDNDHTHFITYRDPQGNSALHLALDLPIAQLFLTAGGDINNVNNDGQTPLAYISRLLELADTKDKDPFFSIIIFLLEHNARQNSQDAIEMRVIERARLHQIRGPKTKAIPRNGTPIPAHDHGLQRAGHAQPGAAQKKSGCCCTFA